MKVSIITVCLNQPFIENTCKSVVNQTFRDFEWIVVDGGSTDGTLDVLNRYRDRIAVFISEKDGGVYNAMNKGIRNSTGDWLCFMNGGDALHAPDVLEKIFGDRDYDADVIYGLRRTLHPDGRITVEDYPAEIDKYFLMRKSISHQASFMRRGLFEKYGLYDEGYKIAGDVEKHLECVLGGSRFQKLELVIADFQAEDIAARHELQKIERKRMCAKFFTAEEMREGRKRDRGRNPYRVERQWKLFGAIPIWTVSKSLDSRKTWYSLLGVPLFRTRITPKGVDKELFGFLSLSRGG